MDCYAYCHAFDYLRLISEMASQIKVNSLKRGIKRGERYLGLPLWKYFLIIFAVCAVMTGGLEVLLHSKRDVDMASTPFLLKLVTQILVQAVSWTAVLRYFGRRDLSKLRRELEQAKRE